MRIRTGFVSNSSSQSFIITQNVDPLLQAALFVTGKPALIVTPKMVAVEMLIASGRVNTVKQLVEDENEYDFIEFPSCNYDTQIYVEENSIVVATCNNEREDWDKAMAVLRERYNCDVKFIWDEYKFRARPGTSMKVFTEYESSNGD